jgi:RNA polymerase sigma factor (sigma-70 family)
MKKKIALEDNMIIEGCVRNDPNYQALLYLKYKKQLHTLAARFVNNDRYIAEDIVQDAFIRIFKGIGSYSQETPLMGWLSAIIYNTSMSFHMSNKRWKETIDVVEWLPFEKGKFSFEDRLLAADELFIAMKLMQKDSPMQYTCFRLYYIEGMEHKEIAEDLQISEGTSKSNVSRAAVKIRENIKELDRMALKRA